MYMYWSKYLICDRYILKVTSCCKKNPRAKCCLPYVVSSLGNINERQISSVKDPPSKDLAISNWIYSKELSSSKKCFFFIYRYISLNETDIVFYIFHCSLGCGRPAVAAGVACNIPRSAGSGRWCESSCCCSTSTSYWCPYQNSSSTGNP